MYCLLRHLLRPGNPIIILFVLLSSYSAPMYDPTNYEWNVQPTVGVSVCEVSGANQRMEKFEQAGAYEITVAYKCVFLDCGMFTSFPKHVTEKLQLSIMGRDWVCVNNLCQLNTNGVSAVQCTVQSMADETVMYIVEDTVLSNTFDCTGRCLITDTAMSIVVGYPRTYRTTHTPVSTIADLDFTNPTIVCLSGGIL